LTRCPLLRPWPGGMPAAGDHPGPGGDSPKIRKTGLTQLWASTGASARRLNNDAVATGLSVRGGARHLAQRPLAMGKPLSGVAKSARPPPLVDGAARRIPVLQLSEWLVFAGIYAVKGCGCQVAKKPYDLEVCRPQPTGWVAGGATIPPRRGAAPMVRSATTMGLYGGVEASPFWCAFSASPSGVPAVSPPPFSGRPPERGGRRWRFRPETGSISRFLRQQIPRDRRISSPTGS